MFHLVDFQVTIAEILIMIMRFFNLSLRQLDLIFIRILRQLTRTNDPQLSDEEPMEIDP
ncbi:ORF6 [Betacoronavirus sp. RsYN04]|nr:ORF6 [Betacoronavirus sp. RmYN05]QWN56226.1 ORF6 [Betacoronavirus sp. RmYN08]QWN56246.1 ORF6 [Betacoronavirus sp. RsYN04]UFP05027.1 hypothetical protein ORF6 [Severe acute respiratory syndrome-related coronavirus]UFP05037.1 hypothetical protein ORF6 [Severe acute respiratory syndrome-related coronavirus]